MTISKSVSMSSMGDALSLSSPTKSSRTSGFLADGGKSSLERKVSNSPEKGPRKSRLSEAIGDRDDASDNGLEDDEASDDDGTEGEDEGYIGSRGYGRTRPRQGVLGNRNAGDLARSRGIA